MSKAQIPPSRGAAKKPKAKSPAKPKIEKEMYRLDEVAAMLSMTRNHLNNVIAGRTDLPILETIPDGRFKLVSRSLLDEWTAKVHEIARGKAS